MPALPLSHLALGLTLAVAPALTLASTTTKYRIDLKSDQEVDLTAVGGQKQTQSNTVSGYVTVTLTDSAAGKAVRLVIDSMIVDSSLKAQVPAEALDSVRGVALTGFMQNGKVGELKADRDVGLAGQVRGALEAIFPRGRGVPKAGDKWTDTTESSQPVANGSLTTRTVTNYTAGAGDTRQGVKTVKVDGAFSSAVAGSQETPNGTANIEGTGTGTSSHWVAPDGRSLGGTTMTNSALTISITAAPQPIPISAKQVTTVTVVK